MLLKEVANLITQRLGIQIRDQDIDRLRDTLTSRFELLGLEDLNHYFRFLKGSDRATKAEWNDLAAILTTGETFFFRDQAQADLLQQQIFPELIRLGLSEKRLRIWSAGCSTGEEPYSLLIMLSELLPDIQDWNIHFLATDINPKALETAKQGVYSDWSFRRMDPKMLPKYFARRQDQWAVADRLKNLITFQPKNLLTDKFPNASTCNMDLIVCRNVFIYFGADHVGEIVGRYNNCLRTGGYLLTGHAELQRLDSIPLQACVHPQSVIYQRKSLLESQQEPTPKSLPATQRDSRSIEPLDQTTLDPVSEVKLPPKTKAASVALHQVDSDQLLKVEQHLQQGRYIEATRTAERLARDFPNDDRAIMLLARAKADQAFYSDAIKHCQRAIELNSFAPEPRYLLAKIAEEQGRHAEARDFLKKVIYLDSDHLGAYLDLAAIHANAGEVEQANRMRSRMFEILKQTDDDQIIQGHGHLTAVQLRQEIAQQLN